MRKNYANSFYTLKLPFYSISVTTRFFRKSIVHIFIFGQKKLNAADCISSDLRTTFSIILGAISAEGSSTISRIYHGLRGYENLQIKLKKLGIKIKLKK